MSGTFFTQQKKTQHNIQEEAIIIVSGLPRSGTSMMMKMLASTGFPILTDNLRSADDDNPEGYYEFERVKNLKDGDLSWLPEARGKVVKVISYLLANLPPNFSYKIIFMQRKLEEILSSQKQMLIRRGETTEEISDEDMALLFEKHLSQIRSWLSKQPNMEVLYVNYNQVLKSPTYEAERIADFLSENLNIQAMTRIVDQNLYHQRHN